MWLGFDSHGCAKQGLAWQDFAWLVIDLGKQSLAWLGFALDGSAKLGLILLCTVWLS